MADPYNFDLRSVIKEDFGKALTVSYLWRYYTFDPQVVPVCGTKA